MKLGFTALAAALVVAGCTTPVTQAPVSNAGVGFDDYTTYAARQAQLRGGPTPATATGGVLPPAIGSEELARAGIGNTSAPRPVSQINTGATTPAPVANGNVPMIRAGAADDVRIASTGISDEQNFDAVSDRESIESDAQRRARQAQAYRVIQPTAVPNRSGPSGPNIVSFALSTSNGVGQQVHRRTGGSERKAQRACAGYPSPDLAQQAFLSRGGPERDRLGLDPDGDGFACGWDPAPFRLAARN